MYGKRSAQSLTPRKRAKVVVAGATLAAVSPAHSCALAVGEVPELLQRPPTGIRPGAPLSGSPYSTHQAASFSFLRRNHHPRRFIGGPFPKRAPRRAPFPRTPTFRPAREVTRSDLPFSCSPCLGSSASTWCQPPYLASPQTHSATPSNTAAPQPSELTGTDSPRLRGLPRGITGLVVRRTRVTPAQ